jgi:Protein of unknown function (DUF2381)
LLVTLADGTELPFTLTALGEKERARADQQVNVFLNPKSPDALQAELKATRQRQQQLLEALQHHLREDTSDYALAKLLVAGDLKQTSFVRREKWLLKGRSARIVALVYGGKAKAAVLFSVTNLDSSKPWSLSEARLRTMRRGEDQSPPFLFGEARSFALRAEREEIAPGETGTFAVVVDRSAFQSESGLVRTLALEVYRQDGLLETHVVLDRRLLRE